MNQNLRVPDEPVRGRIPPLWFWSLSGAERLRLLSDGLLPATPLSRLFGINFSHFAPGSVTMRCPASEAAVSLYGYIDTTTFAGTCLAAAATSALPPGKRAHFLSMSLNGLRTTQHVGGNLIGRARVVNANNLTIYVECQIEDSRGRVVSTATGHAVVRAVEPPPPPPPATFQPVVEPEYSTPDPHLRVTGDDLSPEQWSQHDGYTIVRKLADGTITPADFHMFGMRITEVDEKHDRVTCTFPASEWFSQYTGHVSSGVLCALGNHAAWAGGLCLLQPGQTFAGLDVVFRVFGEMPADGREIRAIVQGNRFSEDTIHGDVEMFDADDNLVLRVSALALVIEAKYRRTRRKTDAKRMLASLLFTDIVDSTRHIERLGNERWRSLLENYKSDVRRAVADHGGLEVDNAGDGFFLRFESPASAVECAASIHLIAKRAGIELRCGVHTGECEVSGRSVTGMTVHLAARIQGKAEPGETLVSGTVKDLMLGSSRHFDDRGEHELKGVPGLWRLYAVA